MADARGDRVARTRGWGAAWTALLFLGAAGGVGLAPGCSEARDVTAPPPTYDDTVSAVFAARCAACHEGAAPAGGWRATSFIDAIACVAPDGAPATAPTDARAPVLRALDQPPHVGLLSDDERAALTAWVMAGAPLSRGVVHGAGFADPRSPAFHGAALRAARWAPMIDPSVPGACGRCHDGAPSRPAGVVFAAPGAPACTSCHAEPGGALGCGTCHGHEASGAPPRDACFFPAEAAKAGAHAAHTDGARAGLACATCHPVPGSDVLSGLHANGAIEIAFDTSRVTPEASFDPTHAACAVSCHDRGGARPRPAWTDSGPMGCGDCHGAPPKNHYAGACSTCHREANASGTALQKGPLHMNGKVDLGDGSGGCGACHGSGDDPWPTTGAHAAHRAPGITGAVACSDCHVVPTSVHSPGHLDGVVEVRFSGRAVARGARPTWDGARCSEVACHGANLVDPPAVTPAWKDSTGAASACGACHGVPPTQHTTSTSCGRATCHTDEVARDVNGVLSITTAGKAVHVNGVIDVATP